MAKLIIFDTETTGLGNRDRIIQVGAIVVDLHDKEYIEVHDELCSSDVQISSEAMAIHGIKQVDIEDKPKYKDTKFKKALDVYNNKENYLIAHNLTFDKRMVEKEGFVSKYNLIDTYQCSIHLFETGSTINNRIVENNKLQTFREIFFSEEEETNEADKYGVKIKAHDAIGDVVILKMFFKKIYSATARKYNLELSDSDSILTKLVTLTDEPALLKFMPYGKWKGIEFLDIERNTSLNSRGHPEGPSYLDWMLEGQKDKNSKYFNKNIFYTIQTIVDNRNIHNSITSDG